VPTAPDSSAPARDVTGGGRQYVERLVAEFRPRIRLATPITGVRRGPAGVEITDGRGERSRYDHVVLACHADQSLGMLEDATPLERSLLGAFRYQPNRAILHRDASLMPRRRDPASTDGRRPGIPPIPT